VLSVLIGLSACVNYHFQPDGLAALTVVPPWCWLVPGLPLIFIGASHRRRALPIAVAGLWIMFSLANVEEIPSIIRGVIRQSVDVKPEGIDSRGIRVVTLNCFVANRDAAAEVIPFNPDIVLLQESPVREHLVPLTSDRPRPPFLTYGLGFRVCALFPKPLQREDNSWVELWMSTNGRSGCGGCGGFTSRG
jgi:hypothetical protein